MWSLLGQEGPGLRGLSAHPGARQRQRRGEDGPWGEHTCSWGQAPEGSASCQEH